jgi:Sugar (and other) transporter
MPLGIQILPGVLLAVGSLFLPPSPRLLVLQGKNDQALKSLAQLRLRTPEEAVTDTLIQVNINTVSLCGSQYQIPFDT